MPTKATTNMATADIGDGPAPRVARLDAVYAAASVPAQQYTSEAATATATPMRTVVTHCAEFHRSH